MRADIGRVWRCGGDRVRGAGRGARARFAVLLLAGVAVIASTPRESRAQAVMRVAPIGVDAPDCGTVAKPCRSIQQAVPFGVPGEGAVRYQGADLAIGPLWRP